MIDDTMNEDLKAALADALERGVPPRAALDTLLSFAATAATAGYGERQAADMLRRAAAVCQPAYAAGTA